MSSNPLVHPTAIVESQQIGRGTRVWAFVHILEGAVVGEQCKIGDHVFIEGGAVLGDRVTVKNNSLIWHGVRLGNDVFVGPNTVFTNDLRPRASHQTGPDEWLETFVEDGASIGANSTIVAGVRLGSNCLVGAGSVVTKSVLDHALVFGNPARQVAWVCECGVELGEDLRCTGCNRRFELEGETLREASW
jgi:acetyltransferase-like isoleucine patch superfamily enzyme